MRNKLVYFCIIVSLFLVLTFTFRSIRKHVRMINARTITIFPENGISVNITPPRLQGQLYNYGHEDYYYLIITDLNNDEYDCYFLGFFENPSKPSCPLCVLTWDVSNAYLKDKNDKSIVVSKNILSSPKGVTNSIQALTQDGSKFEFTINNELSIKNDANRKPLLENCILIVEVN